MRLEASGFLHVLMGLAVFAGLGLLLFVEFDDLVNLPSTLRTLNWIPIGLIAGIVLLILGVPSLRLLKEYRAWKILSTPFMIDDDPVIDVDLEKEAIGHLFFEGGYPVKQVATFAAESGILVRKAPYPKLFPSFEIDWKDISHIFFASAATDHKFGSDAIGAARISLDFAEDFVLVIPWRGNFNLLVPDRIGFTTQDFSEKAS